MLYGVAAIYGKRFGHISATVTATGTMIWAAAVLVPAALIVDRPWTLQPGASAIAAAVALSIVCTGIALMLYFRLVRTIGSLGVASQAYLRAGIGVLLGIIVLGESITPSVALGLFAAILGVALINWPERKAA
jgi:drug/metabolite transporter (DMT)-like permease